MLLLARLKLRYHTRRYNKLLEEQHKREKKMREEALNFMLEEVDRKLERSDATINYYHNIFKENN